MDNERRAELGQQAVLVAATATNVAKVEDGQTAVTDVLAYIAHFCDRLDLDPKATFAAGIASYEGDFEDAPAAEATLDPAVPLAESTQFDGSPI
jgi:hypothetical protein